MMGRFRQSVITLLPLLVLALPILSARDARADSGSKDGILGTESTRIGLEYTTYSGDENKSLTGNSGFGLEAGVARGNSFIQFLTKLRVEYAAGNRNFLDSATQLNLAYRLIGVNAALGIRINPIFSKSPSSFGIYIGAVGTFGMAQLSLPVRTYTSLKASQSGTTLGYDIFAGTEIGSSASRRLFIEAALKTARTSLGGSSAFQIDGLVLQTGLVW